MGGWSNSQMEGDGTYFWKNGDQYVGTFTNNMKEGQVSCVNRGHNCYFISLRLNRQSMKNGTLQFKQLIPS